MEIRISALLFTEIDWSDAGVRAPRTCRIGATILPENTALAGEELTSVQHLCKLAVARELPRQFPERPTLVAEPALEDRAGVLRFGASDFGTLMIEETSSRPHPRTSG